MPDELTAGDVLLEWLGESPTSLLAFFRLGLGIKPLHSKFQAMSFGAKDRARYREGLDLLNQAALDLMNRWGLANKGPFPVNRARDRRVEIDPREIDPTHAVNLLNRFKDHVGRMVEDGLINKEEGTVLIVAVDTTVRELTAGYDPRKDSLRKFKDWDDTPDWIRRQSGPAGKPTNAPKRVTKEDLIRMELEGELSRPRDR